MGTVMNELERSKLLRHLGQQNFDYNELDKQKVEYVYKWLVKTAGSNDWQVLTLKLREVEDGLKKQRQRLDSVYSHVKLISIRDSGRYDITTLKPPPKTSPYDFGWRV